MTHFVLVAVCHNRAIEACNFTFTFLTFPFTWWLFSSGTGLHNACCVFAPPPPLLNQEDRSEKRLTSATSVFLLCVCETPDDCLSCSHANAGRETMATAGLHIQKTEVSRHWGSFWFFDGHRHGFMRKTSLQPEAAQIRSRRGNVIIIVMIVRVTALVLLKVTHAETKYSGCVLK